MTSTAYGIVAIAPVATASALLNSDGGHRE